MSPLPRQGWLFLIEFLKWYFSKYWQVRTRVVFAQTIIHNYKHPSVWSQKLVLTLDQLNNYVTVMNDLLQAFTALIGLLLICEFTRSP